MVFCRTLPFPPLHPRVHLDFQQCIAWRGGDPPTLWPREEEKKKKRGGKVVKRRREERLRSCWRGLSTDLGSECVGDEGGRRRSVAGRWTCWAYVTPRCHLSNPHIHTLNPQWPQRESLPAELWNVCVWNSCVSTRMSCMFLWSVLWSVLLNSASWLQKSACVLMTQGITRLWMEDINRKRGGSWGAYFTKVPPLSTVYPHCYERTDLRACKNTSARQELTEESPRAFFIQKHQIGISLLSFTSPSLFSPSSH